MKEKFEELQKTQFGSRRRESVILSMIKELGEKAGLIKEEKKTEPKPKK